MTCCDVVADECVCVHVCVGCADLLSLDSMCTEERKRQGYIHELIQTEESYLEDLELAGEVNQQSFQQSKCMTYLCYVIIISCVCGYLGVL